jgi:hypothetical protein
MSTKKEVKINKKELKLVRKDKVNITINNNNKSKSNNSKSKSNNKSNNSKSNNNQLTKEQIFFYELINFEKQFHKIEKNIIKYIHNKYFKNFSNDNYPNGNIDTTKDNNNETMNNNKVENIDKNKVFITELQLMNQILKSNKPRILTQEQMMKREIKDIEYASDLYEDSPEDYKTGLTEYGYPDSLRCNFILWRKNRFHRCQKRIKETDDNIDFCCIHLDEDNIYEDEYMKIYTKFRTQMIKNNELNDDIF